MNVMLLRPGVYFMLGRVEMHVGTRRSQTTNVHVDIGYDVIDSTTFSKWDKV